MGISGFFYYLKNKNPKSFTTKNKTIYDYLALDYHSLFHNIKNLYDEINYMIRLLFESKYQYEQQIDYFYTSSTPIKSEHYHIICYIVKTYKNFFKLIGIDERSIKFTKGKIQDTLKKINFILDKFPVSEEIIKNAMIADIVNHTVKLSKQYTTSVTNTLIYFDGIPSVSKMKEQLSRRIGLTISKMITSDILKINSGDKIEEHFIREKLITSFPSIDLNSPLVNETRHILEEKGFTINNKERYGEAEHQMMKDLRDEKFRDKKVLIASPDADLILLSMIAFVFNKVKIDIYRESILSPSHFEFSYKYKLKGKNNIIYSPYMREIFYIKVDQLIRDVGLINDNMILDISYLLLLLGDDFIPIIPTLNIYAFDNIIKIYKNLALPIINTDAIYTINYVNLTKFILTFAHEEQILKEMKRKKFDSKIKDKSKNVKNNYKEYLIFMNSSDNIIIKKIYYLENGIIIKDDMSEKLLITKYQEPEMVDDIIIKNYLEGYQFIFDLYYLNNIKNYRWVYPYEKAPTLNEIAKYLKKIKLEDFTTVFDYTNGVITSVDKSYFNFITYKKYIDDNKNKILKNIIENIMKNKKIPKFAEISLSSSNMERFFIYDNLQYIYKCFNALYIQGCVEYDKIMIDPSLPEYNVKISSDLLGGGNNLFYIKYMKYKIKYNTIKYNTIKYNTIKYNTKYQAKSSELII